MVYTMKIFRDINSCRICLKKQDTVYSIYTERKGISPYEKLNKIGVKTHKNDSGPSSICCECLAELEITFNFLKKCETSSRLPAEQLSFVAEVSEVVSINVDTSVDHEKPCYSESRHVDIEQEGHKEDDLSEGMEKCSDATNLENIKCGECGSKRRCSHWTPPTTFTCSYCQKVFNRKFNFKLHLARHGGERSWWCVSCGAGAVSRALAAAHCAPRRRRACPAPGCRKTFTTNTNLNTHLRTHTGERPFECSECDKTFTSKNTLNDHLRIHTGALPYICPVCGLRFRTNKLSAHMLTHTRARTPARRRVTSRDTHACSICPARYKHKQSLNKHVKKQHAEKASPQTQPNDSEKVTG